MLPAVLLSGAGDAAKLTTLIGTTGRCMKLVVAGRDLTSDCDGKMLNTSYADARTGFYFITRDGLAVTFSGHGDRQVKPDADTAIMPIDLVIVGRGGKSQGQKAVGTCRFVNPYKGPAPLACHATAAAGVYDGEFMTDGSPPKRTDF